MTTLNRAAAAAIEPYGGAVHACTDITGFGLIGHASEMAAASGCSLEIEAGRVPLIDGARALVRGNMPGGGRTNRDHFGGGVAVAAGVESDLVDLLFDPQTSGGLLLAAGSGPRGCGCGSAGCGGRRRSSHRAGRSAARRPPFTSSERRRSFVAQG